MSKNNWKLFTYVGVGSLILGGAIGGAVVFFIHETKVEELPRNNVGPLKKYPCEYKDEKGNVVKSIPGLEFKQYKTLRNDGTYDYYFNDAEMNDFIQRFLDHGFYGPEIYHVKTIWISNVEIMDKDAAGTYYAGTNEIALDPSGYLSAIESKGSIAGEDKTQIKIETLLGVLYHEYGHHFAYSYMNNPFPEKNAGNIDNSIYSDAFDGNKRVRVPSQWNKHFIDVFKHELCYDLRKTPYSKYPMDANNIRQSIGSKYTAQELFDAANAKDNTMGTIETNNLYQGAHPVDGYHQALGESKRDIQKENLPYLYSMSELFTRKLLVSTYRTMDSFSTTLRYGIVPSLTQEESYYETLYLRPSSGKPGELNHFTQRYLQDALFNPDTKVPQDMNIVDHTNTTKNIFDATMENAGQKNGADIAYMWSVNPFRVVPGRKVESDGNIDEVKKQNDYIRFGGYINSDEYNKYSHVGYYTLENGNNVFHAIEIVKNHIHFGYKTKSHSKQWETPTTGQEYFYATKIPVLNTDIAGKKLYFATGLNDPHPVAMTTVRSSINSDYTSTIGRYLPSSLLDKKVYRAVQDGAGVRIEDSGLNNRGQYV